MTSATAVTAQSTTSFSITASTSTTSQTTTTTATTISQTTTTTSKTTTTTSQTTTTTSKTTTTTSKTTTTTSQTTTTTSKTTTSLITTTTSCTSSSGLGSLFSMSNAMSWAQFSSNYTATNSISTLTFTIHGGPAEEVSYLDDVSFFSRNASSIQLLQNPSFENSTAVPSGWVTWCASSCSSIGDGGNIISSGCHSGSGNTCYSGHCNGGYDFLGQSVATTIGNNYIISFWLMKTGGPAGTFYADIN
ncbi:unnamed protein product [Adineta steineri]|uniref:Uncharacterized protein n=1 Tax=Adineta steineri TaxID=433720 RepID=A0A819RSX8_9BILA|nr:unnamed protein product [Adineta steineri]CAF4052177.1 unnamed protein product [Adineta steineri]